jgi:DNA helicase-2/ATP-dependent DNA helicase PcrA
MTGRATQPDTQADRTLRSYIIAQTPKSFVMVAGAGSGKTTSLIKALGTIATSNGNVLKLHRQRVACITYTEIAAGEIWADVGNNPLFHISTIHSFLWAVVKSFQSDIRAWVKARIAEKIADLEADARAFGPRVQERTKEANRREIERYKEQGLQIDSVPSFKYEIGSDYPKGILGHDDIIKMVPSFMTGRRLFRTLVAQQFPFIFVDESQDTTPGVVEALKAVENEMRGRFCLGFFGDPMQRIYPTGIGTVPIGDDWVSIDKPENFRCPQTVLKVANNIRKGGDHLVQTRGRMKEVDGVLQPVEGSAHIFVLPADDRRDERLSAVRWWIAQRNDDLAWESGASEDVKVLVIVHEMAAKRLGFAELHASMNRKAPESFKNGFLDATAWPLRPFISFVLPLAKATRDGREFDAMNVLRNHAPQLAKETIRSRSVAQTLSELRIASKGLAERMEPGACQTVRDILLFVRDHNLFALDERFLVYIGKRPTPYVLNDVDEDDEATGREITSMDAFLACPAAEFWGYQEYVDKQSPFSTQQGIKGAEFSRVLVVLDDDEGTHQQFSYDKYFGITPPSARDKQNIREGRETSVERTRRLFYVCCTRALTDLVVVFFSTDPTVAERQVRAANIFPADAIHGLVELGV